MNASLCGKWKRAFTLIELLVVVAIIALLASILMPTLQKAMQFAHRANCAALLRHHGDGYEMYAQDWDDYVLSTIDRTNWPSFPSGNGTRIMLYGYITSTKNVTNAETAREHPLFLCPTSVKLHDTANDVIYGQKAWQSQWNARIFSTEGADNDDPNNPTMVNIYGQKVFSRRFIDYKQLAVAVNEADAKNSNSFWSLNPGGDWYVGWWNQEVLYRHVGKTLNMLMGDGHVISIGDIEGKASVTNNRFFIHTMP